MHVGEQDQGETGDPPEEDERVAVLQEVGRNRQAAHRRDEVQRHLVRERVQHHLPMLGGWRQHLAAGVWRRRFGVSGFCL